MKPSLLRHKLTNSALACVFGVLAGCSNDTPAPVAAPTPDKVVIKGSNTVGEELGPRLIAEFKKDHPKATIDLEAKGTGSGVWGLIGGACDIAAASRSMIKDEQQQAEVRGIAINDYVIGSYSVAVVVNSQNAVAGLTRDQVRDIFTGAVSNWKVLGGADAPIHLYIRNPLSGTYLGFRELAMEDKAYTTNSLTELTNYAAIVEGVAKDPNGIGYTSFDLLTKPGIKTVSVGGVPASAASVKEGKYPLARVLHFYTNKARESALVSDFIKFVQSAKGQEIVAQMGYVPKP
jgi:phosphate transport system substrate-binding protein